MTSEFVGVDGCTCGWISVGFNDSGDYELKAFFTFDELVEYYHAAKLILVDMPIGLSEVAEERPSDPEARSHLGPLWKTVFRAPTRQAMTRLADNPADREGASVVEYHIVGEKLNPLTLAIMPKINAVDRVMQSRKRDANPEIREIHPEICFWALNNRCPMKFSKHNRRGIEERRSVLEQVGLNAKEILEVGRAKFPTAVGRTKRKYLVADDDILDALAAAVTARRGWPDRLKALPENKGTPRDSKGLRMEMVFWHPQAQ